MQMYTVFLYAQQFVRGKFWMGLDIFDILGNMENSV